MNSRSAQLLAATLTFLLIVLVGATIFILLSRPPAPGPSASPTGLFPTPTLSPTAGPSSTLATPTPTATPSLGPTPTLLPTPAPTDTPTVEPTITPTPSPSPTASPTPTPSPTLPPSTSPQRELTIVDFGLDNRADVTAVQRTVTFGVDGPSLISAQLKGVSSGKARMCLLRNEQDPQRECITVHGGTLTRAVFDSGHTEWNVTVIGASDLVQYASLTLEFNALSPDITLDSFRFNGTNDPHNNGFEVVLGAGADGDLRVRAGFDGASSSYQWHLVVAVDDTPVLDQSGGPSSSVDVSTALSNGTVYGVTFSEPEAVAGGGALPALVVARLTWP
jgi:hypothetical protein